MKERVNLSCQVLHEQVNVDHYPRDDRFRKTVVATSGKPLSSPLRSHLLRVMLQCECFELSAFYCWLLDFKSPPEKNCKLELSIHKLGLFDLIGPVYHVTRRFSLILVGSFRSNACFCIFFANVFVTVLFISLPCIPSFGVMAL